MISILDELVLDAFEHHVESVFDVVFGAARHFLYNFTPLVPDRETLL